MVDKNKLISDLEDILCSEDKSKSDFELSCFIRIVNRIDFDGMAARIGKSKKPYLAVKDKAFSNEVKITIGKKGMLINGKPFEEEKVNEKIAETLSLTKKRQA